MDRYIVVFHHLGVRMCRVYAQTGLGGYGLGSADRRDGRRGCYVHIEWLPPIAKFVLRFKKSRNVEHIKLALPVSPFRNLDFSESCNCATSQPPAGGLNWLIPAKSAFRNVETDCVD